MKKLGIVVLLSLLLAGGGFYYYTTTPTYSILQIKKSVENHDVALFEKHVDIDTLFTRLIDDLMAAEMAKLANEAGDNEWAQMGQAIGAGMVQMMKPTLISAMKSSTLRYVETGNAEAQTSDAAASGDPAAAANQKVNLQNMMDNLGINNKNALNFNINKQGKVATVVVPVVNQELDMPLEMQFTLRDQGGYWQLVQFSNAQEVLAKVEQEKASRLAAANAEVQEKLKSMIGFTTVKKANIEKDRWGISKQVLIGATLQATADVTLKAWSGEFYLFDNNDNLVYTLKAHGEFEQPLTKGNQEMMGWELDINQFMEGHIPLWNLPEGDINARMKTLKVTLADGSVVQEFASYDDIKK